jgi:hypothetical protein
MSGNERHRTCRVLHEMYLSERCSAGKHMAVLQAARCIALLPRMKRGATVQDHLLEMLLNAS